MRTKGFPGAFLVMVWCFAALATAAPALELTLANDAVAVAELEPGSAVVYFDIYRYSEGFVPRTDHRATIVDDDDGDGIVEVRLARELPRKFLAVAVELASGRFGIFRPEGAPGREIAFPADSLREGPANRLDRLESTGQYLELLLVRPGTGAWQLTTGDGTDTDESPSSDGIVVNALDSMWPVDDAPSPPEEFASGDVLVRVAPRQMAFYAVRIER